MGDARLLYPCSSRRGNTHEGNPARNLVRFTQRKRRTMQLISLDCRSSTYAHNSTICQLIYKNFAYLSNILYRWYITVGGSQCMSRAISLYFISGT